MSMNQKIEETARKLHEWYLEATRELNPENYNPKAQKSYEELAEEQKFIDRYIAERVLSIAQEAQNETIEALRLEEREIPKEEQPTSLVGAIGRTEFARDSGYNQAVKEQRKKEQALKEDT